MTSGELASWMEAVGTTASAVVAVTVALAAWIAELRRRSESTRTALFLAELATMRLSAFLEDLREQLDPSNQISTVKAQVFVVSGVLAEMRALFEELRPSDMPTFQVADTYVALRISVRDLHATLEFLSARPGSAGSVPIDELTRQVGDAFGTFNRARAEAKYPLQPRWLVRFNRHRLQRARERLIAKQRNLAA